MSDGSGERLVSGHTGRMLVLATSAWAIIQTGRFLLPPLLPAIIEDLAITPFQAGIALSVMSAVHAFAQYPGGRLSDQLTRISLIVPGLGGIAIAFLLLATAPMYLVFVLGTGLFGLAKAFYVVPSRTLVSDLFVDRRGQAMGVYAMGSDVGGLLASGIAVATLTIATWRLPFLPIAIVLVAVLVLFHRVSREAYVLAPVGLDIVATVKRLLATPRLRRLLLAYALAFFVISSTTNFLPVFLQAAKGFSPAFASSAFALLFAVGLLVKPVAGTMSDRWPRSTVAGAALGVGALALGTLVVAESLTVLLLAIVAFAAGYKSIFPIVDALLLDISPDTNRGGDLGAARLVALGIGSIGPSYVGYVGQEWSYPIAFAGLVGCLLLSAGLLVRLTGSTG